MTTTRTNSHLSEITPVESGYLVKVLDDNGTDLDIVGIYIDMVIPAQLGLEAHDLIGDIEYVDSRFREKNKRRLPSQLFYTLPDHWHHVILVGERNVHLNTGFYTIIRLDGDGQ